MIELKESHKNRKEKIKINLDKYDLINNSINFNSYQEHISRKELTDILLNDINQNN